MRGGPSIQRRPVARRASAGAVTGSPCGAGRETPGTRMEMGSAPSPIGGPPARACHLPLHAQDLRGSGTLDGGGGRRHAHPQTHGPGRRPRLPRAPRESAFLPAQLPQHPHLPSWRWGRSLPSRLAIAGTWARGAAAPCWGAAPAPLSAVCAGLARSKPSGRSRPL